MTRKMPADELAQHAALNGDEIVAAIFRQAPQWQKEAAHAALYDHRPDLRRAPPSAAENLALQAHFLNVARNANYFARVCRLLALYGVGSQW
jgi:hypothetical protein